MAVPIILTPRKREGRTTLVHLSDLHAQADTNYDSRVWAALREDLESVKDEIDVVVATGDLIDNPWIASLDDTAALNAFQRVKAYLHELCAALGLDPLSALSVVAGNHDYRSQGLIWRTATPKLFAHLFAEHLGHRVYPGLRLASFAFDSNSDDGELNLAAGLVQTERLIDFAHELEALKRRDDWADLTKVALLHHHPMPIGPTEHREALVGLAEHVLLKNAGMFLIEMVKARIDFILHGHQHYSALSKACYPVESGDFHTVTVIAGGSAGVGRPPSYYLLRFADTGEVEIEERLLKNATYERGSKRTLVPYTAARLNRIPALTRKAGSTLRMRHYARIDRIAAGSGDDFIAERATHVVALEEPVSVVQHTLSSRSGIPLTRRYTPLTSGQRIDWVWLDPPRLAGTRRAETRFEPPLTAHGPISFERTGTFINAIHFNARDRLDATDKAQDSEYVRASVPHVYDAMTLQVLFPERHWPGAFRIEARAPEGTIDRRESEHVSERLSVVSVMRTASLDLERPLPGYSYSIVWDLPRDEEDEVALTPAQSGMARAIVERLLQARPAAAPLQACLDDLVSEIRKTFPSPGDDATLEANVLCYDSAARGMVPVASVGHTPAGGDLGAWIVRPGRGIEGQAFRRREAVIHLGTALPHDGLEYYEDLPDSKEPPHTVVVAIPVLYPLTANGGRRVAVIRIGTRANTSGLLRLPEHNGRGVKALVAYTIGWFATRIGPALGLGNLGT